MKKMLIPVVVLLTLGIAWGGPREEALQKIRDAAFKAPQGQWFTEGVVQARHTLAKEDGTSLVRDLVFHIDKGRIRQETNVLQSSDPDLAKKFILFKEGERMVFYAPQEKSVLVEESGNLQSNHHGVLSLGIPEFGRGLLSESRLATAELTLEGSDVVIGYPGICVKLSFDAEDRIVFCRIDEPERQEVREYEYAGDMPRRVTVSKFDGSGNLVKASCAEFALNKKASSPEAFLMDWPEGTTVEFCPPASMGKSAIYTETHLVSTQRLLARRLEIASSPLRQNCATAAVRYVAEELGINVGDVSSLVSANGGTSMSTMGEFLSNKGLHVKATQGADLEAFIGPQGKAILYVPDKGHYIGLAHLDEERALVVDLSSRMFVYFLTREDLFKIATPSPVALLVSKSEIPSTFAAPDAETIVASTPEPGWDCTLLIQEHRIEECDQSAVPSCSGYYRWYYERWGCEAAWVVSCYLQGLARYARCECEYSGMSGECEEHGDWLIQYMYACQ